MRERQIIDKKNKLKIIMAGIIIAALAAVSFYTVLVKPRLNQDNYVYKEEKVEKGNLVLGIMESGTVTLEESVILYDLDLDTEEEDSDSEDSEEEEEAAKYLVIEEVYAVSGQRIKEGEALFKLTEDSVYHIKRRLNSALLKAQITLTEAQTEHNILLLSAKSTYDTNVIIGNRAAADYQAGLTKNEEEIKGLEAEIKVLEAGTELANQKLSDEELLTAYEEAKTAYIQAKNKYEETDLHNSTAYTSNFTDYTEAQSQLNQIEKELQGYQDTQESNQKEMLKKQKQIELLRGNLAAADQETQNNYEAAKQTGELAEEIYSYTMDSYGDTVTAAETDYNNRKEQLQALEAFVGEDNIIYADASGLVTTVKYGVGEDLVSSGAMLSYAKEDEYTVSIDVSEEDIAAVGLGDSVNLTFSACPDEEYQGVIAGITTTATSEHASTISYPVTVKIEGDTSKLYGGMTADVTFVTDSVTNVLYVSRKAVFEENGVTYVYYKGNNEKMEQREVQTGFSDGAAIEIISGLAENDVIYIKSRIGVEESELTNEKK